MMYLCGLELIHQNSTPSFLNMKKTKIFATPSLPLYQHTKSGINPKIFHRACMIPDLGIHYCDAINSSSKGGFRRHRRLQLITTVNPVRRFWNSGVFSSIGTSTSFGFSLSKTIVIKDHLLIGFLRFWNSFGICFCGPNRGDWVSGMGEAN